MSRINDQALINTYTSVPAAEQFTDLMLQFCEVPEIFLNSILTGLETKYRGTSECEGYELNRPLEKSSTRVKTRHL